MAYTIILGFAASRFVTMISMEEVSSSISTEYLTETQKLTKEEVDNKMNFAFGWDDEFNGPLTVKLLSKKQNEITGGLETREEEVPLI